MICYMDNAATSWPKPKGVAEAMSQFLAREAANPGRSGHRMSIAAARVIYDTRELLADLFNIEDPLRIVFGLNATEALNLAMHGLLCPGDHVITGSMEHNSVMRPLRALRQRGVQATVVPCSETGVLAPESVHRALRANTKMIVLNHASNIIGTVQEIGTFGVIARENDLLLLIDAAQSAGAYPIDVRADCIDLLAFTGHKSLYGPPGVGGLYLGERVPIDRLRPLKQGGTGSNSEKDAQPEALPDKFESGTPNSVGIAGLKAGLEWLKRCGRENIRAQMRELLAELIAELARIERVTLYGAADPEARTATLSFTVDNCTPSEVGARLDEEYGILCRTGLHCAPEAHKTIGTFPHGTVRIGLGAFNTREDVVKTVEAIRILAGERR